MLFAKLPAASAASCSSVCLTAALAVALASSLLACMVEDSGPRHGPSDPLPAAPVGSGTTPASPSPLLVVVDTDQVMNADPGQGVGIFTEYFTGGKWHVWWTCDTTLSNQTCDVALNATVATGTITELDTTELQGGTATAATPSRVEARVTTSTQVHGIRFTTDPGAVVTLDATVGGLREGPGVNHSFFFFVQDGKVNGGFTGRLTNPLQLQGKTP